MFATLFKAGREEWARDFDTIALPAVMVVLFLRAHGARAAEYAFFHFLSAAPPYLIGIAVISFIIHHIVVKEMFEFIDSLTQSEYTD